MRKYFFLLSGIALFALLMAEYLKQNKQNEGLLEEEEKESIITSYIYDNTTSVR